jgi:para-aminobenzoate synthetase component 1
MRKWIEFRIPDTNVFIEKLIIWGSQYENFVLLNSNRSSLNSHLYQKYDLMAACIPIHNLKTDKEKGFESLKIFHQAHRDWIFGFLAYDLKNEIECLKSNNLDKINFPNIYFFVPKIVFLIKNNCLRIEYLSHITNTEDISIIFNEIYSQSTANPDKKTIENIIHQRFTKEEYTNIVSKIKNHIQLGDIYELNLCQEFYSDNACIEPTETYKQICTTSPAPFSVFLKHHDKYLISSSPERFLAKQENKIISQPIKGTIKRGQTQKEDLKLKEQLLKNEKERAENIMIVDLVRNDLSRTAKQGSVNVEELCKIYTYPQLHQMISTISSQMDTGKFDITDVIRYAFPMGSMTGAPKIRAMELIEKYEKTKRGLYSGSVGYIAPNKDFDFNVVIRSILYNSTTKYLSFLVGSAITHQSIAEDEYEECMLKAKGMMLTLSSG